MSSIARSIIGTLYLQDDMLKQASDKIRELERELTLAKAHIRILECKLQRRPRASDAALPALLRRQAE